MRISLLNFIVVVYIKSYYTYYENLDLRLNNKSSINLIVVTTRKIVVAHPLKTPVAKLVRILLTTLVILKFSA